MNWRPEEDLTDFQRACEERLRAFLDQAGVELEAYEIAGNAEPYVTGLLGDSGLRFFIYLDGAEISSDDPNDKSKVAWHFENADYVSLDHLAEAFVNQAIKLSADRAGSGGAKDAIDS